jgi:hypothetical protein
VTVSKPAAAANASTAVMSIMSQAYQTIEMAELQRDRPGGLSYLSYQELRIATFFPFESTP